MINNINKSQHLRKYLVFASFVGSHFLGYQCQGDYEGRKKPVQNHIEQVLRDAFNRPMTIQGCSRTDKGVNALKYAFHFVLNDQLNISSQLLNRKNKMLSYLNHINNEPLLRFNEIFQVDLDFHAQKSVTQKEYQYMINANLKEKVDCPFYMLQNSLNLYQMLDVDMMEQGCRMMEGEHNWLNLCNRDPQYPLDHYYFRKIDQFIINTNIVNNVQQIQLIVRAKSFYRYQIRFMVGILVQLGLKKISLQQLKKIIDRDVQEVKKHKAKAEGLFLTDLYYEKLIQNQFYKSKYEFNQ